MHIVAGHVFCTQGKHLARRTQSGQFLLHLGFWKQQKMMSFDDILKKMTLIFCSFTPPHCKHTPYIGTYVHVIRHTDKSLSFASTIHSDTSDLLVHYALKRLRSL